MGGNSCSVLPLFNHCSICERATGNPQDKNNRMRPSFLVEMEKGNFLSEANPDLRMQSARFNLPPIKNYLISHDHYDHINGLKELHSWIKYVLKEPPTIYGSPITYFDIKRSN